ncbi:glycosyltransferase family 2 protein [Leptospira sp. 96542]|nr:glycosyltransferase family 2 protein [Leptospira sp. 96542]
MPLPISCAIITLNEEENIVRCLKALSFIDDIVVVDSGSTDNTVELAKSFGARVMERNFDFYPNQKNYAIEQTKHDWVLAIDADEVVSSGLKTEIINLFSAGEPKEVGFLIPRLTYYLGKWIRFGGFYPNYQIRLFQKSKGKFGGGFVHERVVLETKPKKLKFPLYHFSYKNISDHLHFIDRYSSLFAEEEYRKGKTSSILWALTKASFKGFYMYWIRLGILDGKQGFVLAVLGFYYNFLKYLKLYEKNQSFPSFFVMVDSIHDVKSNVSTKKNSDQIHI